MNNARELAVLIHFAGWLLSGGPALIYGTLTQQRVLLETAEAKFAMCR